MKHQGKANPYKSGVSEKEAVSRYNAHGRTSSGMLLMDDSLQVSSERRFDLKILRESNTYRKSKAKGWVLRNRFNHRSGHHAYGILFQMMLDGAIRYEEDRDAYISQVCEQTFDCVSTKNGTIMDVYFGWDGMIGTNSHHGYANFSISLALRCGDDIHTLSEMDGISYLGAKTCKGRNKITNVFVRETGTPVQILIRYEMELMAASEAYAVSEVHFNQPSGNFFKIVTR